MARSLEEKRVYRREYYKNNKEKECAKCKEYRSTHKLKRERRSYRLFILYGITEEQYNELFISQGGCCAICGVHQSKLDHPLHVDHIHNTKKIRGLLCRCCNNAIGLFKDNIFTLERAIMYLKNTT